MQELTEIIKSYSNSAVENDRIYEYFTNKTDTVGYLKEHRDYIEKNNLGFGERAFAYMWYLIMLDIKANGLNPILLEIGVFKGQVISLWELISKNIIIKAEIFAITPLKGNPAPKSNLIKSLMYKLSKKYKKNADSGNYYEETDYLNIIKGLFNRFNLEFGNIQLIKGYSTDPGIINTLSKKKFAIIYVDGDHTFEGVTKDIQNFAPLVQSGGFLVMDDAASNLPGGNFWKGHQSVSDACKIIESFSFKNVLNVGHTRIYQKL